MLLLHYINYIIIVLYIHIYLLHIYYLLYYCYHFKLTTLPGRIGGCYNSNLRVEEETRRSQ